MNKVILIGKAAAGKDHMRKVLEGRGFKYGTSYTTRPPREGEIDGREMGKILTFSHAGSELTITIKKLGTSTLNFDRSTFFFRFFCTIFKNYSPYKLVMYWVYKEKHLDYLLLL